MDRRIIRFDKAHIALLPQPQEPFDVIGWLTPTYDGTRWHTSEELLDKPVTKTYPNERFDPFEYIDNPKQAAFLAMLGERRVGSVRVCERWNGNAFIDDLTVDRACRGQGFGRLLMDAAVAWSEERGLNGVSLETQNNNLIACRFYRKYGFVLGGIDTNVYTDPQYSGETALYFYLTNKDRSAQHDSAY